MNAIKITCLGHGRAFDPVKIGNSAYLLEYQSDRILLDCGHTVPEVLEEMGIDFGSITACVISHLHADHVGGLERLLYQRRYVSKAPALPLIMGSSTCEDWKEMTAASRTGVDGHAYVNLYSLFPQVPDYAPDVYMSPAGLQINSVRTQHGGDCDEMPCYGFFIDAGRSVFFSGDRIFRHPNDARVFEAMSRADLVLHELEISDHPCGVHTHMSHIMNSDTNAFKKFRWHHHGQDPAGPGIVNNLKLVFKGDMIIVEPDGSII